MRYLDSSVVIAAYYPKDPHHKTCEKLMRDLSSGKDEGVISLFGLAEIAGFISRNTNPEIAESVIALLQMIPNLHIALRFAEIPAANLMELCLRRGLSGADALHVIHAQTLLGVDEIITLDRDFMKVKDLIHVSLLS